MYFVETFPVGLFQCNCSILINSETREAMVIDPGDEFDVIADRLQHHGANVLSIWHSHAHIDHIGATKALYDFFEVKNKEKGLATPKIFLHEGDRWLYEHVDIQAKMLGLHGFEVSSKWEGIVEGQSYESFPGLKALHTPGHTPGSSCLCALGVSDLDTPRSFYTGEISLGQKIIFSGDTLFRRSIGRTDLWGGDSELIIKSIRGKLLGRDPNTLVIPGHGPLTTLEEEKEKNPFLRG